MTTRRASTRRGNISYGSEELKQMNDDLRREMEEIRSCNQQELLKAWEEVEQLVDEKDELMHENEALTTELMAARKREDVQIKKLKEAEEAQDAQVCNSAGSNIRALLGGSKPNTRRSFTSGIHDMMEDALQNPSKKKILAEREKVEKEFFNQVQDLEQEKEELVNEWKSKVECREKVLESLEKTTMIQGESIARLRKQLERQGDVSKDRVEAMEQKLEELAQKVKDKNKVITKQEKKMDKYRDYIEDLSSELQRLAGERGLLAKKTLMKPENLSSATIQQDIEDAKPDIPRGPSFPPSA
mmetsp:Transcript_10676/g.16352  ORF Transcript_10676/g.16352 Transcript_10676/m.16352 type:complete len:300 (-) Transcript_10676:144-1043(-)